jgi:SsrA-binding protein
MTSKKQSELVSNRSASHHYELLEKFEAGIALLGTEVKSLRENQGSLQESYIKIKSNELWLVGAHIAHYSFGNMQNHEEKRERKLLMHKNEILRLKAKVNEKGLTLVPLSMYLLKGKVKLLIALGKGRKAYDKRQKIKSQEADRAVRRELREI